MVKVKAFVTKYAYWLFLAGLSALFCGACFTNALDWTILIYVAACSVFFTPEQIVATTILIRCFDGLTFGYSRLVIYLFFMLVTQYAIAVAQRRQTVSTRVLLVLFVFSMTFLLRMLMDKSPFGLICLYRITDFGTIFLVYELRKQLDWWRILRVLAIGLIISGVLGLLVNVSPFLQTLFDPLPAEHGNSEYAHEYYRFQGLTVWSTQYASIATVVVGGLLLAKYQKRINNYWFYGLFVPVYLFGYQTLTRTFLLCVVVALILFTVFCFVRDRRQAWRTLLPLAGVLVAVSVIFFTATMGNFERIFHDNAMAGGSEWDFTEVIPPEAWEEMKHGDGTYYEYLGRKEFWAFYASDFCHSPVTILLGRGITHVFYAGHTAHNWYLFFAWKYGLSGIALFGTMLALMVNWRGWRTKQFWTRWWAGLIMVIPWLVQAVFDDNGFWAQMSIMLVILWCATQPRLTWHQ